MKAIHIGFEHRADDVRIYLKECNALSHAGFNVFFITTKHDNTVFTETDKCKIIEIPYTMYHCSRFFHPIKYYKCVYAKRKKVLKRYKQYISQIKPDVIHVHEYRLLKFGLKMSKIYCSKIVYDIHEDVPRQMENYSYRKSIIFRIMKLIDAKITEFKENYYARKCDLLITATPHLKERFQRINDKVITVCNYPIWQDEGKYCYNLDSDYICYVGTIFKARGISELLDALDNLSIRLKLAGKINPSYRAELEQNPNWQKVDAMGYIGRDQVKETISNAAAGMVTLLNTGNIVNALPVKLFEYMRYGIPVIASDFPGYKEIVEGNECGICVDSSNPKEISKAIKYILDNRDISKKMGENGVKAVYEKYNWNKEKEILITAYNEILN